MQVIAGAVERIDHPGEAAAVADAFLLAAFLAQNGVVGIGALELLDDLRFGQAVNLAGIVEAVFLDDIDRVEAVHMPQQHVAAGSGRLDHDVDGRLLHTRTGSGRGT